jgi:hypothetical protein
MTININELLEQQDINPSVLDLVKSNLQVVPVTIYKLQSKYSNYTYTEDELNYSSDHINQLIDDIIVANLDKVKHLDNRIYKFFEEGKTYYQVKYNKLFNITITRIYKDLESVCDKEYDYILTEHVHYQVNARSINQMFTNDKNFLKFGGQYLDKFFETKDEALTYIKIEQNGQTN